MVVLSTVINLSRRAMDSLPAGRSRDGRNPNIIKISQLRAC